LHNQDIYSITFSIASRCEQLALVRAAMFGVLQHLTVITEDIYDLQLAVSEIVNNTLEHGYRFATDQRVEVTLKMCRQMIEVEIVDSSPAFPEAERYRIDEETRPLSEPSEDWPTRGHGLQIARQVIDSLQLSSKENENRFTIRKSVRLRPE
jgi:anti-sigma regulatory factor (Ser/Thr protein kinase)